MLQFYIFTVFVFSSLWTFGQESEFESIKYDSIIHLSYQNNPDNLEPVNFNDKIENYIQSSHRLEKSTEQVLMKLISDTSKFRNSECGTPFYEGSFVFYSDGKQVAISFYACNKTQMYFEPRNIKSKSGALTIQGVTILKEITN